MERPFTVIRGGKETSKTGIVRTLLRGQATDTRLMGVIGLDLTWEVQKNTKTEIVEQIFYLDSEEYGIESFLEGYGRDSEEIEEERNRLYSSLGGSLVPVSEREARFLLQAHACINTRYGQPLPEGREKYAFLINQEQCLTAQEYEDLFDRICGDDTGDNFTINYFMMRCISGDAPGAHWLMHHAAPAGDRPVRPSDIPDLSGCDVFQPQAKGTLCRNSIQSAGLAEDRTYFCEALAEYGNHYHLITALLRLSEDCTEVLSASRRSDLRVTGVEAAMMVNRSEFISVYTMLNAGEDDFEDTLDRAMAGFTETRYENGTLYIQFKENNDHAGQSVYRINDDIKALYYVTDSGQLVLMGYTMNAVRNAEFQLFLSLLPFPLMNTMKYEFREPVMYEYLQSGYVDFADFLASLAPELSPESD